MIGLVAILLCTDILKANTLWKSVSRGSKIDADLQRYQLQITTRSSMGSNEGIFLVFYDDEGRLAGGAVIYFFLSRHVDYMIPYCGDDFVSVYAIIPSNQDTVWSIHRTEYGLKIEYNGRVLVDYHTTVWCKSYWERRVTKFEFHYSDDASKTYRIISPEFDIVDKQGFSGKSSGLLLYSGGTVCSDGFNHNLVNAICSNLGYKKTDKHKWTTAQGWDIRYNYDIKLGNFNCRDDNWSSCSYNTQPWDCSHDKDALLFCNEDHSKRNIIIGIVAALLGIGVVGFLLYRKHKKKQTSQRNESSQPREYPTTADFRPTGVRFIRESEERQIVGPDSDVILATHFPARAFRSPEGATHFPARAPRSPERATHFPARASRSQERATHFPARAPRSPEPANHFPARAPRSPERATHFSAGARRSPERATHFSAGAPRSPGPTPSAPEPVPNAGESVPNGPNVSPPSYTEAVGRHENEEVPSYEDVIADTSKFPVSETADHDRI